MLLRSGLTAAALVMFFGLAVGATAPSALADPWKDESGHGRGRAAADHHLAGGPPPWAPAHGYRRKVKHKHEHAHEHRHVHAQPGVIDLDLGRCNRDLIGAVLGGTVGGVIGSQIGEGAGRAVATAGGVLIGAVIGGTIGRKMDERDRACVAHALDLAPRGRLVSWDNPETGVRYELTPLGLQAGQHGRSCREFVTKAVIDGKSRWTRGTACRQPDGAWGVAS